MTTRKILLIPALFACLLLGATAALAWHGGPGYCEDGWYDHPGPRHHGWDGPPPPPHHRWDGDRDELRGDVPPPPPPPPGGPRGHRGPKGPKGPRLLPDMTPEQAAQCNAIMEPFFQKESEIRDKLFVARAELKALENRSDGDVTAVTEKAKEVVALDNRKRDLRRQLDEDLRKAGLLDEVRGDVPPPPPPPGGPRGHRGPKGPRGPYVPPQLTPEQAAQYTAIIEDFHRKDAAIRDRLFVAKSELKALENRNDGDVTSVTEKAREVLDLRNQKRDLRRQLDDDLQKAGF